MVHSSPESSWLICPPTCRTQVGFAALASLLTIELYSYESSTWLFSTQRCRRAALMLWLPTSHGDRNEVFHEVLVTKSNSPPTPAYQGERAQRWLAKANNIEHTHTHISITHATNTQQTAAPFVTHSTRKNNPSVNACYVWPVNIRLAAEKPASFLWPGHAVSPFRRARFGKHFGWEVVALPGVTPKRNWRCISKPIILQNLLFFFKGSGRDVWHWRSYQRRSKNGVLELARPCCFPVSEGGFGEHSRCKLKP